jgi:hypothetical protein
MLKFNEIYGKKVLVYIVFRSFHVSYQLVLRKR